MSKLLVVDDEESICWGLSRLGESLGHEVVAASSAEQAFDEVERQAPDVIVLDVRLPGMDGLAAIERFQKTFGSGADHRDYGVWRFGDGGRGGSPRGVRLHRQAV